MGDNDRTRKQLVDELVGLRRRNAELEASGMARERIAEPLRGGEERFRSLFETMAEGVVLIAPDGQIVQANPAVEHIFGLERSEIEGHNYVSPEQEIYRSDGTLMPLEEMPGARAMREKRSVRSVVVGVKRSDRPLYWLNVSATPIMDESGKLEGVVATFADITSHVLAEEKLRKSVALDRLRASVYEMREPVDLRNVIVSLEKTLRDMSVKFDDYSIQIIDAETNTASHSWRAQDVYHYEHGLVTYPPTEKTAFYEAWRLKRPIYRRDLKADDPYDEWESIRRSYEKDIRSVLDIPFSHGTVAINSVLPNAFSEADVKSLVLVSGVLSEAYTRFEDIQKLKVSEEELRKHRDHLGKLVEERTAELRESNVELNREIDERRRAEDELRKQMNLNKILIDQMPCVTLLIRPETREIIASNKAAEMVGAVPGEKCYKTWAQREEPCPWCCAPAVWETGAAQHTEVESVGAIWDTYWIPVTEDMYFHFASDITKHKQMEEELLKVEKLESIGVLAGGIAHDLNNLLTGVVGNISLARLYDNPSEKDRRLAQAENASMRIKDLTQQLLTFAKGGAPIRKMASIEKLLRNSVSLVLSGSNVKCKFSIPDDLWPVEMDEGQMNQVVSNIIINANQAMEDGGVVEVRAENMTVDAEHSLPLNDGEYVKISIEDHGIGIPEADLSKIFDPFFTNKQSGNGLGLAIAYSIVNKHDGHITVESEPEIGTTLHIYIPASSEQILAEEKEAADRLIPGEGRILVMDDNECVSSPAVEILSNLGYRVVAAVDGAAAIELYKEAADSGNPFDAVILDLTIPGGMGGGEVIQELLKFDPEVKAIVSSGYSNDHIMTDFGLYGFKGVIAKPYKAMELSAVLYEVMTDTAS